MNSPLLQYGDAGAGVSTERPKSFDELKQRLSQLGNEYRTKLDIPYSVDLVIEGRGRLSIGLGDGEWMLFYTSEDGDMLSSVGDRNADGSVIFFFGDHTLLSRRYLVSKDQALSVIETWFEKGEISHAIDWTRELF
jgi:hypothetical protein